MLEHLQQEADREKYGKELKLAMLASGRFDPADLFDEFKNIETDEDEIDDGADEEGEPIQTTWDFSNAEMNRSQEEVEREIQEMLAAASTGSNSLAEPIFGDWT